MQTNWTIVTAPDGFKVTNLRDGDIAKITCTQPHEWSVRFTRLGGYDFEWSGASALDICIGYVRGVERAVAQRAVVLP
jgi:hypothetical protein